MSSAVICPYCRTPVVDGSDPLKVLCPDCGTPHHTDCFEENGGCTIFGCSAAPADEPKLSVAAAEAHAVFSAAVSPAVPPAMPPRFAPAAPSMLGLFDSPAPLTPQFETPPTTAKSRMTFILLGVLLGIFGAHSFYAGYTKRGVFQLVLSVCTVGIGAVLSWVWAVIDICTISEDAKGIHFRD